MLLGWATIIPAPCRSGGPTLPLVRVPQGHLLQTHGDELMVSAEELDAPRFDYQFTLKARAGRGWRGGVSCTKTPQPPGATQQYSPTLLCLLEGICISHSSLSLCRSSCHLPCMPPS